MCVCVWIYIYVDRRYSLPTDYEERDTPLQSLAPHFLRVGGGYRVATVLKIGGQQGFGKHLDTQDYPQKFKIPKPIITKIIFQWP